MRTFVVLALSSLWGGVAQATDAPTQIQYVYGVTQGLGWTFGSTFKMANGLTSPITRLNLSLNVDSDPTSYFFDFSGGVTTMTQLSGHTDSSAIAGSYAGVIVGESDATGFGVFPCYWSNPSSPAPVRGSGHAGGRFWEVNASGVAAGTWYDSGGDQTAFYYDGTAHSLLHTNYSGNAARAVNNDGMIGGQLFSGTNGSPPALWLPNGSGFDIVDIGANSDYQAAANGRAGYIVGITDSVEGDDSGPYAVGWVTPGTNPETTPGRPFIYSIGSDEVKFVGTKYGEPLQVGNAPYTYDDPVVSFVGNTPRPYVWMGSPDKNVANYGVADDVWALFDPDVHVYDNSITQIVTGMNRSGLMAGSAIDSNKLLWVSRPESDSGSPWHFVEPTPTSVTETAVTGSVVGGNVNDLRLVEGKYMTLEKGSPDPSTDPEWVVQVEEHLASGEPGKLAVRTTVRSEHTGTYTQKFWLYNWDTTTWDQIGGSLTLTQYMQSPRALVTGWSTISHYVRGSDGLIAARASVKKSGIMPVIAPDMSFEQLRIMVQ